MVILHRASEDDYMLGIASTHLGLWMGVLILNIGAILMRGNRHLLPLLHHEVILLLLLLLMLVHDSHLVEHILLLDILELLLEHELVGQLLVYAGRHHGGSALAHTRCILIAMRIV